MKIGKFFDEGSVEDGNFEFFRKRREAGEGLPFYQLVSIDLISCTFLY